MRNFSIIGIISNSSIIDSSIHERKNSSNIDSQIGSVLTTCINPIAIQPPFTAKSFSSIENIAKPGDIPYVLQFSPNLLGGIFFSILRSHLSKRLDNQIDTLKK